MAIVLSWIGGLALLATPWGQMRLDAWLGREYSDEAMENPEDDGLNLPEPRFATEYEPKSSRSNPALGAAGLESLRERPESLRER